LSGDSIAAMAFLCARRLGRESLGQLTACKPCFQGEKRSRMVRGAQY
jgi:hypothetical protein